MCAAEPVSGAPTYLEKGPIVDQLDRRRYSTCADPPRKRSEKGPAADWLTAVGYGRQYRNPGTVYTMGKESKTPRISPIPIRTTNELLSPQDRPGCGCDGKYTGSLTPYTHTMRKELKSSGFHRPSLVFFHRQGSVLRRRAHAGAVLPPTLCSTIYTPPL